MAQFEEMVVLVSQLSECDAILQDVLHPKDVVNQRYPRKRALYLAGLAQYLASSSDIGAMRYSCLHGNRLRPVLLLTPPGIYSKPYSVF